MDTIETHPSIDLPYASPTLMLEDFLPYRLSVLSSTISRTLARLYERRFGITVGEWRVIANLARHGPLSANGVCDRSAMDKVQVSRAVAKAVDGGLIDRSIDPYDRRRSILTLTAKGRSVHDQVLPLAREYQDHLRTALDDEEHAQFLEMLSRLLMRASSPRYLDS